MVSTFACNMQYSPLLTCFKWSMWVCRSIWNQRDCKGRFFLSRWCLVMIPSPTYPCFKVFNATSSISRVSLGKSSLAIMGQGFLMAYCQGQFQLLLELLSSGFKKWIELNNNARPIMGRASTGDILWTLGLPASSPCKMSASRFWNWIQECCSLPTTPCSLQNEPTV